MVKISQKIMRFSNVRWIDNKIVLKRKCSPKLFASAPKHQRSDSILEKTQDVSSISNEIAIFTNFQFFKLTQNFSHLRQGSLPSRLESILSSAPSSI